MSKLKCEPLKTSHYFASSVYTWRVNTNLEEIIKDMKSESVPFTVVLVPKPITDVYEIAFFMPVVDGCVLIANYSRKI